MIVFMCHYGCGKVAIKQNKSGNWMCDTSSNKCPENKRKNSEKVKNAYDTGKKISQKELYKNLPIESKNKMAWSRGLTKETNESVNKIARSLSLKKKGKKGIPHTEATKQKLRKIRIAKIAEGLYDSSGKKGHRGHYDNVYFHSSWELAYYVWSKECLKKQLQRNKNTIKYVSNNKIYEYIPDFIDDNNMFIEIKGYLYSDRDKDKYSQSKDIVTYLFKEDLEAPIKYCKQKYGNKFWEILYG